LRLSAHYPRTSGVGQVWRRRPDPAKPARSRMIPDVRMKDPYEVLGLAKTATPEEIRKAYRQLAKKLHPDLNPGDKHAEERFKEVSAANDLLSDPEKRRRYDAGEIDA